MTLRQSVRDVFVAFSEPLEGVVYHLYLDVLGYVTTGMGHLLPDESSALALPWRIGGVPATPAQIRTAYGALSQARRTGQYGAAWGHRRYEPLTPLRLTRPDVERMVQDKLTSNHTILQRRCPDIAAWPAPAQLFLHSWAWAVGPNARYPRMIAHMHKRSWLDAANEARINPNVGTIVVRNARNRQLLLAASEVECRCGDYDVLTADMWSPPDA